MLLCAPEESHCMLPSLLPYQRRKDRVANACTVMENVVRRIYNALSRDLFYIAILDRYFTNHMLLLKHHKGSIRSFVRILGAPYFNRVHY